MLVPNAVVWLGFYLPGFLVAGSLFFCSRFTVVLNAENILRFKADIDGVTKHMTELIDCEGFTGQVRELFESSAIDEATGAHENQ